MRLEIDTSDKSLLLELIGDPPFRKQGEIIAAPGEVALVYQGLIQRRSYDLASTIEFIVTCSALKEVVISLFSAWLYDKLKDRAKNLRVDGQNVQLTPEAVRRIFEKNRERT